MIYSLLSATAATANSAYEFSESLHEMGACFPKRTALNEDKESGRVLLMLEVQFELQKLVDVYEMKQQCDEKRERYEQMLLKQREKGRRRNANGEGFSLYQLQAAQEEYDEEATSVVFRLKSLKS